MHWIDPEFLPEVSGVVDCFLINADGEADGFVLTDGTEVHVPPHMGRAVLDAVTPGRAVGIRGVRPRDVAMIAAVAVTPEDGAPIVDLGPPKGDAERKRSHEARTSMEVEGVLRQALHGPKGEVRGVLLEDGRAGRFPHHAAEPLLALLRPGQHLVLRGEGTTTAHGVVVAVREIGTSADDLRPVELGKDHKPGKDPKKAPKPPNQDGHTAAPSVTQPAE